MKSKRYTITASHGSRELVEIRLSRTRREMFAEAKRLDELDLADDNDIPRPAHVSRRGKCSGACRSWSLKRNGDGCSRPALGARIVARVYLCKETLSTEIFTHELGHAAMAYARLRRADLGKMPGEEVMCYALGHMCSELGDLFHRIGAWR